MKKFENFKSNLAVLRQASSQDLSNEFIISGIIDKFSLQFELGWKVLKELLAYEGSSAGTIGSPRGVIKAAFVIYPFMNETIWLDMLKDRNDMTHIYDGAEAQKMADKIIAIYIPEFNRVEKNIESRYGEILNQL